MTTMLADAVRRVTTTIAAAALALAHHHNIGARTGVAAAVGVAVADTAEVVAAAMATAAAVDTMAAVAAVTVAVAAVGMAVAEGEEVVAEGSTTSARRVLRLRVVKDLSTTDSNGNLRRPSRPCRRNNKQPPCMACPADGWLAGCCLTPLSIHCRHSRFWCVFPAFSPLCRIRSLSLSSIVVVGRSRFLFLLVSIIFLFFLLSGVRSVFQVFFFFSASRVALRSSRPCLAPLVLFLFTRASVFFPAAGSQCRLCCCLPLLCAVHHIHRETPSSLDDKPDWINWRTSITAAPAGTFCTHTL
jgi:hypothetical protein